MIQKMRPRLKVGVAWIIQYFFDRIEPSNPATVFKGKSFLRVSISTKIIILSIFSRENINCSHYFINMAIIYGKRIKGIATKPADRGGIGL
jgi:hypothetical protein